MSNDSIHPKNDVNSVGFPEGQLLANGASADDCAAISEAYHLGKPLPVTDNEVVNRVAERLTQTSGYGQHSDWGDE